MANAFKCDMCGQFFTFSDNERPYAPMHVRRVVNKENTVTNYDICDFCADRIETLISFGKVSNKNEN